MAYGTRTDARAPRNDANDQQLRETLAGHARGSIDVIIAIASARNVSWAEAFKLYHDVFEDAAQELMQRIANKRSSR